MERPDSGNAIERRQVLRGFVAAGALAGFVVSNFNPDFLQP